MIDNTNIKPTRVVYPQIYAYTIPNWSDKDGWVKIGYTERFNVEERIKEQTHTAAFNFKYNKLWSEPAKYSNSNEWFKDIEVHNYLCDFKKIEREPSTEWFFYNGNIDQAYYDFLDFRDNVRDQTSEKLQYKLREEQAAAVLKTLNYARKHIEGEFLWNAKPRFGKTLSTYDLIRKLDAVHVLIVTNRPAIANSWFDDFEKFIAWQTNYSFVSTSESLKNRPVLTREEYTRKIDLNSKMIAFVSLQDLKGSVYFGGQHDKLKWVEGIDWDLLVIDEAHEGVDTLKTDIAFDSIKRKFTLHLSGTPFKAVASGKFDDEQIFNWTYSDEQKAKTTWDNPEENNPYEQLPKLNLFTYQMSQMITDEVNKGANIDGENLDFAFDLNEFFETKPDGEFIHEKEVKKWLNTLTGNEKYPFSTKELRDELKHTFWILDRVDSAKALQKILKEHPVFENYEIVLAAGDGKTFDDDQTINEKSLERVRKAIMDYDKTITLSVGQLTTGITVPEWSAVLILSNIKSASLYMQASFRAQNPWRFEEGGQVKQKENAYIFDFAPERTLIIYDEFANNLSIDTIHGGGTTENRKQNIKELLNFFPVIAEDQEGKMVEIDFNQVLTIPKTIKAQEVVKRGFMSNFLFQNISGIFASTEVIDILHQLDPVNVGKVTPSKDAPKIDTKGIKVDDNGKVLIDEEIIINQTNARFGEKVYSNPLIDTQSIENSTPYSLPNIVSTNFKNENREIVKELAKDNGVSVVQAERILNQTANAIAREVVIIQAKKERDLSIAKVELERKVADAQHNDELLKKAREEYDEITEDINQNYNIELSTKIDEKRIESLPKITKDVLEKAAEKKRTTVEDDVRARLRGFARTIPSFLMAYGDSETTLSNFDKNISGEVFKEVTGITIEQFKLLRDEHQFFDQIVFDQSVQEFLHKRIKLANYFDDSNEEDIFDYIPPQQTNQIFTPKRVVKMMIDKLEEQRLEDFTNPNKTFADLYMKSGLYLTEIVKRLYKGLENKIPDKNQRIKHILEKQVYGFAPSEIIYRIAKNYIFGFDERAKEIDDSHIVHLDTMPYINGKADITLEEKCDELFGGVK